MNQKFGSRLSLFLPEGGREGEIRIFRELNFIFPSTFLHDLNNLDISDVKKRKETKNIRGIKISFIHLLLVIIIILLFVHPFILKIILILNED